MKSWVCCWTAPNGNGLELIRNQQVRGSSPRAGSI
jgi:hypothetical protein